MLASAPSETLGITAQALPPSVYTRLKTLECQLNTYLHEQMQKKASVMQPRVLQMQSTSPTERGCRGLLDLLEVRGAFVVTHVVAVVAGHLGRMGGGGTGGGLGSAWLFVIVVVIVAVGIVRGLFAR